ncbi:PP0621 family protein [Halomonas llamarensis]|uniref:HTTM domain-containing protein n=1 Tax=Halomonas llamarensis TaxID=2945104 RepID=A0ABT0SPF2_9GAMM|nr:PP0621 family protein [Halomonas llamarensis]MCL7929679.1 HTTM domain-containing protein [Halomonas llamarensis]
MNLLIIRFIIFAVLFFAGLKLYGMYREWKIDREALEQKPERRDGGQMVRCQWCDVHVPEQDALREQKQWFCSSAHRDRFLQEQRDDITESQKKHEDSNKRD